MKNKGITLIALIITIVILLILASTSVSFAMGNNGIIEKTKEAKVAAEIAKERENVDIAAEAAFMYWPYNEIKEENFIIELDNIIGKGKYSLSYNSESKIYTVTYVESKRSYDVENKENNTDDGKNEDNIDESTNENLIINTQIATFAQNLGTIQVSYNIKAIQSGNEVYQDIVNVSCSSAGEKKTIVNNIPAGSKVTITAIYNTDSYVLKSNDEITTTIKKGETAKVDFSYDYGYKNISSDTASASLNYNGTKLVLNK